MPRIYASYINSFYDVEYERWKSDKMYMKSSLNSITNKLKLSRKTKTLRSTIHILSELLVIPKHDETSNNLDISCLKICKIMNTDINMDNSYLYLKIEVDRLVRSVVICVIPGQLEC